MQSNSPLHSAIYSGWVQHRRYAPRGNAFRYKVFMIYLDLAELEQVEAMSPLWGRGWRALARFRRDDFFGDPKAPLDEAVRQRVASEYGQRPEGPIRMLANWRYFGFNMNPISVYYCFDAAGDEIQWLLLDVHNTPWNERHGYVLDCRQMGRVQRAEFNKEMHVSPFMAMDQRYRWRSTNPAEQLSMHLQNIECEKKVLDATLSLRRQELTATSMNRVLIQYPLMTVKVITAIYWQALKLWWKRVPVVAHPKHSARAESGDNRG